jgi:hypothetical protein
MEKVVVESVSSYVKTTGVARAGAKAESRHCRFSSANPERRFFCFLLSTKRNSTEGFYWVAFDGL